MQVFKDYNLSGMNYCKIGDAKFRALPKTLRKRFFSKRGLNDDSVKSVDERLFFLQHTSSIELLWPKDGNELINQYWLRKQTSCDLEFDTTVQKILNVVDVMKELPSPLEERQKVHWRAVPSLREIWEQERKRMALLLPPENDFLSCKDEEEDENETTDFSLGESSDDDEEMVVSDAEVPPPFTLNVKKHASLPGARHAVKGMQQLFNPSLGLEDELRRAMKDILSTHEVFLDELDEAVKSSKGGRKNRPIGTSQTLFMSQQQSPIVEGIPHSPSFDEGIEALAALGAQFTQISDDYDEDNKILSQFTPITRNIQSIENSHYYGAASLSQEEVDDETEALAFGQAIDEDEIVVDAVEPKRNATHIDPFTLEVMDDDSCGFLDDEDQMGEKRIDALFTQLATQSEESDSFHCNNELTSNELDEDNSPFEHNRDDYEIEASGKSSQIVEENTTFLSSQSTFGSISTRKCDDISNLPMAQQSQSSMCTSTQSSEQEESQFLLHGSTLEPVKHSSLRCADIMSSSWYETPEKDASEFAPHWFHFQWNSPPCSLPLQCSTFLEPVSRPPSFSHVRAWMKENRKRSSDINTKHVHAKQQKIASKQNEQTQDTREFASTRCSSLSKPTQDVPSDPLDGIGNQGGKLHVSSGGLKTSTTKSFTPLTIMSIEVHVQCRIKTGMKDHRDIAMVPDPNRDAVVSVVYVYGRDPGGGECLEVLETGVILVTVQPGNKVTCVAPKATIGLSSSLAVHAVRSEEELLRRVASVVRAIDPDSLVSWDTQGAGIGYLIERGCVLGKPKDGDSGIVAQQKIDMARLLGRTPKAKQPDEYESPSNKPTADEFILHDDDQKRKENEQTWAGSGLGGEWDDRVGAGAAAASIVGRIVMCGWKIISEEVKHPNASYQPAIVAAVLKKRIPFHDDLLLTRWFSMNNGIERWRVIEYRIAQAMSTVLLFDALDILGRAGEAARLSNVEFSQSLPGIRGSQYKVEGVLLRALQSVNSAEIGGMGVNRPSDIRLGGLTSSSKETQTQSQSPMKLQKNVSNQTSGYFFFSPSKVDCSPGGQEALECQALTLEPRSGFYNDPVVVCDFTAIYPSLVIAYNLCYSTVAGKLEYHSTRREMRLRGQTTKRIGPFQYSERRTASVLRKHMKSLYCDEGKKKDKAYAVPTGAVFVSEKVVKGVLPQVLDEMLSTRAMLKKAAKEYKKRVPNLSPSVLRQIEARQLALKYVANVTYGYTSATFSGRSAAPLVADTIVELGRRTLSNAISLANKWGKEERWKNAEVLYGDTDSIFIRLPGRSVSEAFTFGEEFCRAVTESNPPPVQLKLEKVYSASMLQTKKKYCGMMYESASQKRPIFEAKGIETVRRDQCALTQRVLRNALINVFEHGIQPARAYLNEQWALIHSGGLPVSEFVLTGRVRSRYRGGKIGPVQAALARRLAEVDPGRVVRHKERLPYVIVASPGMKFRLRENVLTPLELLEQWDSYSIHCAYYTTKHVNAALQRCFGLAPFKANISAWYDSWSPKPRMRLHYWPDSRSASCSMISKYFGSDECSLCGKRTKSKGKSRAVVCNSCQQDKVSVVCTALSHLNETQQQANALAAICSDCNGLLEDSGSFAREEITSTKGRRKRLSNPMANCVCIDCPITYKRHRLRECEIEAMELCKALNV